MNYMMKLISKTLFVTKSFRIMKLDVSNWLVSFHFSMRQSTPDHFCRLSFHLFSAILSVLIEMIASSLHLLSQPFWWALPLSPFWSVAPSTLKHPQLETFSSNFARPLGKAFEVKWRIERTRRRKITFWTMRSRPDVMKKWSRTRNLSIQSLSCFYRCHFSGPFLTCKECS